MISGVGEGSFGVPGQLLRSYCCEYLGLSSSWSSLYSIGCDSGFAVALDSCYYRQGFGHGSCLEDSIQILKVATLVPLESLEGGEVCRESGGEHRIQNVQG